MLDRMLPSLVTLTLLFAMFLWALLIDFLIHLQKRGSLPARNPGLERRKSRTATPLPGEPVTHPQLPGTTGLPSAR